MANTTATMVPLEGGINDALARISSQDIGEFYALLKGQVISPTIYELMISQLEIACARVAPGPEPAFVHLTQKGVELMRSYSALSYSQQLSWIRTDMRVREAIYARDQRIIQSQPPQNNLDYHAMAQRM